MSSEISAADLQRACQLIRTAKHAVALTGAGISTPSGIPDFRSTGSGLWTRFNPMEVASITAFRLNPEKFYKWMQPMAKLIRDAKPNPAHIALARLEAGGKIQGVITQNIDALHAAAGSKRVVEIHGHLRKATCGSCYREVRTNSVLDQYIESGEVPRCPECGGILKPGAVLFGEELPYAAVREARDWIAACDLLIVVGSSLEVTPVAFFPVEALNAGAHLIIVNRDRTYVDERAAAVFHQDVALVLPRLAEEVLGE